LIPGEKLILLLEELRVFMNASGIERTAGLHDALGDDCSYYRKSLDLFLDRDFDKLDELIHSAKEEINKVRSNG